jgi:hypothetical protein
MQLKYKLFLSFTILYIIFSTIVWTFSNYKSKEINVNWIEKFVKKQVLFDKNRTLVPILNELAIVEKMVKDKDIINLAKYENDPILKQNGINALEKYREEFKDKNYFAAFATSKNYYFNNDSNNLNSNEEKYNLSENKKEDKWFFDTLKINEPYQINVNEDSTLKTKKVWINFLLKDNGQNIGIVGTGIDLSKFLKETVDISKDGIRNIFINDDMAIQLDRDSSLIDFSSLTKNSNELSTLELIIKDKAYINNIKTEMENIKRYNTENIKTMWIKIDGKNALLAISYLKEVGWFSISLIEEKELILVDNVEMFIFLSLMFFVIFVIILLISDNFIITPLKQKIENEVTLRTTLEYENIKKDRLINLQMRFISIGGIIENIIHQWKIPLVRAGTLLSEIEAISYLNKDRKDMEDINKVTENLRLNMELMQETIGEFHDFYQTFENKELFVVSKSITKTWHMLNAKAIMLNAKINIIDNENISIFSYSKYLSHIFLILIDNFLNITKEREIKDAMISFLIENISNNLIQITVEDNCKGIKNIPLRTIFNSSNGKLEKTSNLGVGLIFAEIFTKDKLEGNIGVKNTKDGAKFTIQIPKELR